MGRQKREREVTDDTNATLHHIDNRLILVEERVESMAANGRWLRGIAAFLALQIVGGAMAFSRISQQMETLDLDTVQKDVSTAMAVLTQHRKNIDLVSEEQARVRGRLDHMNERIDMRTANRFTSQDGAELKARILRLEDFLYQRVSE